MITEDASHRLAIFTRVPKHGHLKTRLARHIGVDAAYECYVSLLNRTLDIAIDFHPEIWYAGDAERFEWARGIPCRQQCEGDLGYRMLEVFQAGHRMLIGCDCPLLTADYLTNAFEALRTHDLVLGPVEDGGYFLIGMNEPHPDLFKGPIWGSSTVANKTIEIADELGLVTKSLQTLWDVDRPADYDRWNNLDV